MTPRWLAQPERGSGALIRFIAWLALTAGRSVGRVLLYPICAYFLVCSRAARAASRQYLARVLERPARLGDIFRHYHTFAATILDRVFFLTGRHGAYEITITGAEPLHRELERGQGCILLGAHLGSFEVLRMLAVLDRGLPLKVLMYAGNAHRINAVLDRLSPEVAASVIPLGTPGAMLQVREWLAAGGIVGMLGDRIVEGDKLVCSRFLGHPCRLPAGPLLLAGILKVPVVLFFGLYRGGRRYEIHFELLAQHVPIDRRTPIAEIEAWAGRYLAQVERHCRSAPYNWFNFYDFWEHEGHAG